MKKIILLISVIVLPILLKSQEIGGLGSPYIKVYSSREYKADPQCLAAIQDNKGLMYIANTDGVLVYDSHNWTLIPNRNHSKILSLAVDRQGLVILGGFNEFGYLANNEIGQLKYVSLSAQLPESEGKFGEVFKVAVDGDRLLFVSRTGIFEYKKGKVSKILSKKIENAFYANQRLFVFDSEGEISYITGNQTQRLFSIASIKPGIKNIAILPFLGQNLLITDNAGVYQFDAKATAGNCRMTTFKTDAEKWLSSGKINDAIELKNGKFAIASTQGIAIIGSDGKVKTFLNRSKGLQINDILSIFLDSNSNLWAMSHTGFSKIETESMLSKFDASNGIEGVICATKLFQNTRYVASQEGIFYLHKQTDEQGAEHEVFTCVKNGNHPSWNFFEFDNQLLVGTTHGIMQVNGTEAKLLFDVHKTYNFGVSKKFANEIFVAGFDGLMSIHCNKNGGKSTFTLNKIFKDIKFPVWAITSDANGDLWISTLYEGVFYIRFKGNNLDEYDIVKFSSNAFPRHDHCFTSITDRKITVCTPSGLYTADLPNVCTSNSTDKSDLNDKPYYKAEDIHFKKDTAFARAFKNKQTPVSQIIIQNNDSRWINISSDCGLLVNTPDGKTKWQPITFKDKPQYIHQIFNEGNLLWICSDYGLFRYDASVHLSQSLTYNALITKVTLNNDSVCFWENQTIDPVSKKLLPSFLKKKISYTFNSVLFDFAATSYIKESDNEYRYKLDGFDKEWSPWSGKMAKEYTNLHEGTYCFKVQSRNILGQESTIAEFHFVVAAPWYRTLWAYLLYVAFAGLFFYLGLKTYTKSLKEINLKLERTVAERTLEIKQQAIQLEKLSLVARETDNAVVLIDRDFKIEWVNEGFTRLYGFTLDEYIARHGRSLVEFSVNPKIGETINQCVQTKKSVVYQTESPTKIGKTVWTQTTLTPILDSNGEIEKFVVLETDIHKLKEAERAIIAQAKELSKANAVLEETQSELLQQKEELLQVNTTLQDSNDKISHQNDFIQSSIRYAKNIQEAILPLSERLDKYVDWAVIYQPKDIVSGDFYWFARLSGREEFILATIDCTGHGVPGAFMSMVAERLLNEVVKINGIHNPAEILTAVDASLKKALKQDKNQNNDGMDITLCLFNRLDDDKTKVIYAGAKTKLYYFKQIENKILTIKGDSKHIGGQLVSRHHEEFHNHELILDKGDTLVMLTDGIIDQNDCNRKRFGTQKLVKILEENINLSTTELRDCVFNELNTHMEGTAQRDDITVFFVRI